VTEKDKILKDISLTLYIPLEVVKKIVESQFEFVAKVMKSCDRTDPDTFKNVNVQYLGKFAVKESKKSFYNKLKDDRTEGVD
jgi:hypothetical protein